ncbi:hypothetical protein Q8F55_001386 [Vanrija albida]|uniref:Uncharacterized protein n=1 Tax=Vanrija albida TaxID=181172 RepID=A0ABR3QGX1_9TREE
MKLLALALGAALAPSALAWGAAGHEIVATIAQIHLHPQVRDALCSILPKQANCQLAPVAAWADMVRRQYPETGPMHYINPRNDEPGGPTSHCEYGEHGWYNEDVNVLTAIMNKTQGLIDGEGDITLRFLVHFLGDLHQPLHLTGRDKGGNGALFRWEGRARNLHSIWDSGIITKNIRELSNYTSPLPSKQIEDSLPPNAIFDPYVRWIVWEGIREWWRDDVEGWLACPDSGDPYPHSSVGRFAPSKQGKPAHRAPWLEGLVNAGHLAALSLPDTLRGVVAPLLPVPNASYEGFNRRLLANHPSKLAARGEKTSFPACPYTWSKSIHGINCQYAWPREYTGTGPLIELDTPEYIGHIDGDKVLERLLAQGGLRLAKILNRVIGKGEVSDLYIDY